MSTNCAGKHVCEPTWWPSELGQQWTCDDCGAEHYAFDVHATHEDRVTYALLGDVPLGTLGWTTTMPAAGALEGEEG